MEKGYFIMDGVQTTPSLNIKDNATNNYIPPDTIRNKPQSLPISNQQLPSYTNDYLTPCSPNPTGKTHAQPPQLPALPAGGFNRSPTEPSVKSREGGEQLLPRADSGIEADFKPSSSANPRSSTIYESIDAAGNVYTEPSPHTFHRGRSAGGETSSSGVSSLYPAATVPSAASDSEDAGLDFDNVRHRLHPEYNTLKQSNPQLYSETCLCSRDHKETGRHFSPRHSRHLRYLWCGLVVLTFITLLLLAIIAYVFVLLIPGMQAHMRTQENDIKNMRLDYQNLSQRVDAFHLFSTANPTIVTSQTSETEAVEDVALTVRELNASVHEFDSRLQRLSDRLQLQINNISRVPDLTGVSGVGNLSACFHRGYSTLQALPGPPSTTSWMPPLGSDQFRNNMVMSVTCGVQGGTQHQVETRSSSPGRRQYRCRCEGHSAGHDRRICHIYMVLCPRLLPLHLSALPPV